MLKINKILSKKIKFPLSLRGLFPFCHSRESGNPSSPSLRGAKQRSNLSGFSLIELMVAVAILAFVIFGIFQAYSTGFMGMADARERTVATNYAREAMEDIKNTDFEYISAVSLEQISGTKYKREVSVEENVEGSPNLKKITVRVLWEKRNGDNINVETSMLINKIEFLPDVASKLLLYVTPYNIIFPYNDHVNIIAVVKDAKGNTVTTWDKDITFTIESINPSDDISGYLKKDEVEVGIGVSISIEPINGIATIMLYSGEVSTLDADEIGNINISAETSSAETGELSGSVDVKVTLGAIKVDLISADESIKINESTTITAKILKANDEVVTGAEADIIFNVYGEGTLPEPLTRKTTLGEVEITLYATSTPGIATVTASADNLLPGTIDVYVTGPPKSIYVEVNPNHIYMDQDAEVTATLKDINGVTVNAESDITINFSLLPEPDAQGDFTDESIIILSGNSLGSTTFTPTGTGNGTVQATADGLADGEAAITINDTLVADYIEVSADPSGIAAGGEDHSVITAIIKSPEPEGATVYNYSEPITFTTDKGSFSEPNSDTTITLTIGDDNYQEGVAWIELYSNSEDTSGVANINVTSVGLTEGNTEVTFYVEADHITLTSSSDPIHLFGVPDDTCTITATIKDINDATVPTYVGTVTFSILSESTSDAKFITAGSAIVTVNEYGQASVDLRGKCLSGDVVVHAVSTFGESQITSEPDLTIAVADGIGRSIELVLGSVDLATNKKGVGFTIDNTGVDLKIYNLKATWGSSANITEIKIDGIIVYSGSVSDRDIVDITPTDLSYGEHEIYFTYSSGVDNTDFEIILNAEPDCELLEPIIFST